MKRTRFTEEQKIGILREGESASTAREVCAKHNISDATYYAWKKKYGDLRNMSNFKTEVFFYCAGRAPTLKSVMAY